MNEGLTAILLRREDGYKLNYFDFYIQTNSSFLVKIKQFEPLLLSPSIPDLYLSQTAPESLNESPAAPLSRQERDNLNHLARNLVDPSVEGEDGLQEGDYSQF